MVCGMTGCASTKSNHCNDKTSADESIAKEVLTVVYGSFVSVGVPMSGMNGGIPSVEKNVAGVEGGAVKR